MCSLYSAEHSLLRREWVGACQKCRPTELLRCLPLEDNFSVSVVSVFKFYELGFFLCFFFFSGGGIAEGRREACEVYVCSMFFFFLFFLTLCKLGSLLQLFVSGHIETVFFVCVCVCF